MIVRIVKLTFQEEYINDFITIFKDSKELIRNFEGCTHLQLLQDENDNRVIYTYSNWISAANLEKYRNSDLFKNVWKQTKSYFNGKPEAWSVDKKAILK